MVSPTRVEWIKGDGEMAMARSGLDILVVEGFTNPRPRSSGISRTRFVDTCFSQACVTIAG